jgi:hypothetical protein
MPYIRKWGPDKLKPCATCNASFEPKSGTQKYCCKACKRKAYQVGGPESTERQYTLISGNWERYFGRLCVKAFRRDLLTKHDCIAILEAQNYRCALTGVELTCRLEKGVVCKTNASLDRKDPKGAYTKDNVHLVCAAINKFRIDLPVEEFIDWCNKVSAYAIRK